MPPTTKEIRRGQKVVGAIVGKNSNNDNAFFGPCPPLGRVHHYHFKVYALDTMLQLDSTATQEQVERAMQDHIIAKGELVGTYESKA